MPPQPTHPVTTRRSRAPGSMYSGTAPGAALTPEFSTDTADANGPQLIATRFLLLVLRSSDRGDVEIAIELALAVRKPDPPKVKDNVMSDEEPIDSILAEDVMETNRDYVLRERRFRDLGTDILGQRWTETFGIRAADLANQEVLRENNDAEAELWLRQIEPPYETVKAETEGLAAVIPPKEKDPEG